MTRECTRASRMSTFMTTCIYEEKSLTTSFTSDGKGNRSEESLHLSFYRDTADPSSTLALRCEGVLKGQNQHYELGLEMRVTEAGITL